VKCLAGSEEAARLVGLCYGTEWRIGALLDVGQYYALCVKNESGESEGAFFELERDEELG
jgi:hypothetical protein